VRARLLLALVLALLAGAGLAGGASARDSEAARAAFARGVTLYGEEDYATAIEAFLEALADGPESAALHYNLGNAYFKAGRLGAAIWHYRKARQLAPRDDDIAANLEYARFLALDAIEGEEARTDLKVETWLDRITPGEAARVAAGLWILAGLAAVAWQLTDGPGRRWRRAAAGLLILWGLALVVVLAVDLRRRSGEEAVVLAREIPVRNGPGETFETAFVLHEGAEVVVEGDRGRWTEISLPGDLRGWIDSEAIARLHGDGLALAARLR
jgi:tetratricopeptide (TPR) repeat protein